MPRPPNIPKRNLPTSVKLAPQQDQLTSLIANGLALHQQGKYTEAQAIYEKVLGIQANHFGALQLIGTLFTHTKQFLKAVDFLAKALQVNPNHVVSYCNRGIALKELRRLDEALESFNQAIRLKPDYLEAYSHRGAILQGLQRLDEALENYDKAIELKSDDAASYYNRGTILQGLQRLDEALESFNQAISLKPDYAAAYSNRGNVLKELQRLDEALESYDKAISLKPDYAAAYSNRGILLKEFQRLDEALESYDKAISLKPDYAEAYSNRGILLKELQRLDEALESFDKAISLKPDYAAAYSNRSIVLQALQRLDEALESQDKAISLKPDYAEAYSNRGNVLRELQRLDEALESFDKAIILKPDYAEAYSNRGLVLKDLQYLDEALESYDKALRLKPDYPSVNWNISLCHLLDGNFKDGWSGYEWRWKNKDSSTFKSKRNFLQPLWLGAESLKGKTILLYAEQGLGDTIQFSRYAPLVALLGAKVILEVQRPLVKLLKNIEGVSQIIAKGDNLPDFDYQCPLLSLPLAFKTELQTIPPVSQYMTSDSGKVMIWQSKLGKKSKPRIGLVWSGNAKHKNDHNRSLSLSQLLPSLPPNIEYVCLQKELRDADKELLAQHSQIKYFGDALADFTDTAALCELMDVVISVDTSVAHLAGALGKQTWVLLPFGPDWRWLLDREDNPWYPSVKLYRQEKAGDWSGVMEKIKADIYARLELIEGRTAIYAQAK